MTMSFKRFGSDDETCAKSGLGSRPILLLPLLRHDTRPAVSVPASKEALPSFSGFLDSLTTDCDSLLFCLEADAVFFIAARIIGLI